MHVGLHVAFLQSGRDANALGILAYTPSAALINQTLAHALSPNVSLADLQCAICSTKCCCPLFCLC